MRKIYLFTLLFGLALFVSSNHTYSQTTNDTSKASTTTSETAKIIGKIFTKAEADSLYGPVLNADTIQTADLAKLAENSPKSMMFNFIEGKAVVLNSSRTVISGAAQTIKPEQVFRVLSTSKILELIKQGGSGVTTIETRANNIITLTNGATVLEQSAFCPPICP